MGPGRSGSSSHSGRRAWRSSDNTRGIRIRLKRLVAGVSLGKERRRQRELAGESRVTSGDGVVLEAVQEGSGTNTRTYVR